MIVRTIPRRRDELHPGGTGILLVGYLFYALQ